MPHRTILCRVLTATPHGRPTPLYPLLPRCTSTPGYRPFHSTPNLHDNNLDTQTFYETLQVQPTASPAEIKKSFYKLSKSHHPDHNPDDPLAPKRFMKISEAYATLSNTDKRARYDRDVLPRNTRSSTGVHHRSGSYSSTGPAGGRPPSGLSRRRTQFRGPPPSFYRSGGWGNQGAKRQAAHEESRRGADATSGSYTGSAAGGGGGGGGGVGGTAGGPQGYYDETHFSPKSHTRTQEHIFNTTHRRHNNNTMRRETYSQDDVMVTAGNVGLAGSFFLVMGVLTLGLAVPMVIVGMFQENEEEKRAERARRREERARLRAEEKK